MVAKLVERIDEYRLFGIAADGLGGASFEAASAWTSLQAQGTEGFGGPYALDIYGARLVVDAAEGGLAGEATDEDLARFSGGAKTGGEVDRGAHGGALGVGLGADRAEVGRAGVDANGRVQTELVDGVADLEAGTHGVFGRVLGSIAGAEEGEEPVAEEPVDLAAVVEHRGGHGVDDLLDELRGGFGIGSGGVLDRTDHVGEESRNDADAALVGVVGTHRRAAAGCRSESRARARWRTRRTSARLRRLRRSWPHPLDRLPGS